MSQKWEYAMVEWLWDANALQFVLPDGTRERQQGSYVEVTQLLTRLGREGWEAIGSTAAGNWVLWTLKRPVF